VRCNERVKLRLLVQLAEERGVEHVATGHYARIVQHDGRWALSRAHDARKDQTYFLYRLDARWLPRLLFPVGSLLKAEVWTRAEALGLPAEDLKESQEICFVSEGDYRTFLANNLPQPPRPGFLTDPEGRVLGQHDGIAFYTPGQRKGLGIAAGQRLYVHRVDPTTQTVVVGPEEGLYRTDCHVAELNLLDDILVTEPRRVAAKIRYATPPGMATVTSAENGTLAVDFETPQRALSPGQSAVFYDGDRVLGGGIIQPS
jgi:tRNA-specific 2-thiouridylase